MSEPTIDLIEISKAEVIDCAKKWMRYVEVTAEIDYSPEAEALARAVTLLESREGMAATTHLDAPEGAQ